MIDCNDSFNLIGKFERYKYKIFYRDVKGWIYVLQVFLDVLLREEEVE